MASRVKEDEKNEKIIRGLLKLPENRRCVNCNSLGPQYVCINFWTFVCTNCSGIHREFTHRVKSVSMAKFTSQEVGALQGGGNQRAREIYLKEWDAQRNSFPDSSNVDKLRDFIKHVYVDKRYTTERSLDKPPRVKMGDKEELYDSRRTDTSQNGSRSPYNDAYDRRYSGSSPSARSDDRSSRDSYGGRSPGYEQYNDQRRSPGNTELVNDWRRDDRFGNGRGHEEQRISSGDSKLEGRSPERQKSSVGSSPPLVRPVREILGENVTPLRVIEPPKANSSSGRASDGFAQTQRTASSSSLGSTNGNLVEPKNESLIDFDAVPDPPVSSGAPQAPQTTVVQSISNPNSSSGDQNWASFDFAPESRVSQVAPPVNSLESVFSQLTNTASVPGFGGVSGGGILTTASMNVPVLSGGGASQAAVSGSTLLTTINGSTPAASSANNFSSYPAGAPAANPASAFLTGSHSSANNREWPGMQPHQHTLFLGSGNQPGPPQFTPVGGAMSNQQWFQTPASSISGPSTTVGFQATPQLSQGANSVAAQAVPVEANLGGRKALPEDLFAPNYSSMPPNSGWQTGPPHNMGFSMQYNTSMAVPAFPQSPRSTNPFDLSPEQPQGQASVFPSMAPLQGALPNMVPPTLTSLGSSPTAWMPQQSSPYTSAPHPHAPSYASALPPIGYNIGQQVHSGTPTASYGSGTPAFGPLNPNPQLTGIYATSAAPNSLSSGGNPFA